MRFLLHSSGLLHRPESRAAAFAWAVLQNPPKRDRWHANTARLTESWELKFFYALHSLIDSMQQSIFNQLIVAKNGIKPCCLIWMTFTVSLRWWNMAALVQPNVQPIFPNPNSAAGCFNLEERLACTSDSAQFRHFAVTDIGMRFTGMPRLC